MLRVHESEGLGDMGPPTWQVTMCLLTAYIIIYFAIWRGVKSSGKVGYFICRSCHVFVVKGLEQEFCVIPNYRTLFCVRFLKPT